MKKIAFSISLVLAVACGNDFTQKVEISPTFTFSIPQRTELVLKDSSNVFKSWEASFEDDNLKVFKYQIRQSDIKENSTLRQEFKRNIDAFLQTFDFENIDSTFTLKDETFQSSLVFDFMSKDEKYKFFGRFMANKQNFVAFCFLTPFPVDTYSNNLKDKLFNSIQIK